MNNNRNLTLNGINMTNVNELSPVELMVASFGEEFNIGMLDSIGTKYADVLKYEFGMMDGYCHSVKELAQKYGVSIYQASAMDLTAREMIKHQIKLNEELSKSKWLKLSRRYN